MGGSPSKTRDSLSARHWQFSAGRGGLAGSRAGAGSPICATWTPLPCHLVVDALLRKSLDDQLGRWVLRFGGLLDPSALAILRESRLEYTAPLNAVSLPATCRP